MQQTGSHELADRWFPLEHVFEAGPCGVRPIAGAAESGAEVDQMVANVPRPAIIHQLVQRVDRSRIIVAQPSREYPESTEVAPVLVPCRSDRLSERQST